MVVASQGSPSSVVDNVRFRLDNLGPQPGSRKKAKRKGRGISAGQGNSCGFGMRGQKSRSGPGVMKGFEGGQMPLYRRIPKLRGIAGGNEWLQWFHDCFLLCCVVCWVLFIHSNFNEESTVLSFEIFNSLLCLRQWGTRLSRITCGACVWENASLDAALNVSTWGSLIQHWRLFHSLCHWPKTKNFQNSIVYYYTVWLS